MTASASRLVEIVTPAVTAAGYDLEDLTVTAAGRRNVVRVLVDKDGGVTLDDVAAVSRAIGDALDLAEQSEPDLLGDSYVLEASSPGIARPLTEPRHWRRGSGRLVIVTQADGSTVTGRIVSADDSAVVLEADGVEQVLPYAIAVSGAVQIEFSRKGNVEVDEEADA